jgi:hypothetical protein
MFCSFFQTITSEQLVSYLPLFVTYRRKWQKWSVEILHVCLFVLGFTSHRRSIGHIATFQLLGVYVKLYCYINLSMVIRHIVQISKELVLNWNVKILVGLTSYYDSFANTIDMQLKYWWFQIYLNKMLESQNRIKILF